MTAFFIICITEREAVGASGSGQGVKFITGLPSRMEQPADDAQSYVAYHLQVSTLVQTRYCITRHDALRVVAAL